MAKALEFCILCAPDECTCNQKKKPAKVKPPVKVQKPTAETAAPAPKPIRQVKVPEVDDESKLFAHALYHLKPLLSPKCLGEHTGIIPTILPPEYAALAWRERRKRESE